MRHHIFYSRLSVSKSIFIFPQVIIFSCFCGGPPSCGGPGQLPSLHSLKSGPVADTFLRKELVQICCLKPTTIIAMVQSHQVGLVAWKLRKLIKSLLSNEYLQAPEGDVQQNIGDKRRSKQSYKGRVVIMQQKVTKFEMKIRDELIFVQFCDSLYVKIQSHKRALSLLLRPCKVDLLFLQFLGCSYNSCCTFLQ